MKLKWVNDAMGSIDLMLDGELAGWVTKDPDGYHIMTHERNRQAWSNRYHLVAYPTMRQAMRALRTHAIVRRIGEAHET